MLKKKEEIESLSKIKEGKMYRRDAIARICDTTEDNDQTNLFIARKGHLTVSFTKKGTKLRAKEVMSKR